MKEERDCVVPESEHLKSEEEERSQEIGEEGSEDSEGSEGSEGSEDSKEDVGESIRVFITRLLFFMGKEDMPWPDIPASSFHGVYQDLRGLVEGVVSFASLQSSLKKEEVFVLHVLGECALHLLRLDWSHGQAYFEASEETHRRMKGRPKADIALDQLFCTPDSTERRIKHLLPLLPRRGKVLFLGDDDLSSLVLGADFDGELHLVEFDTRLLEFVKKCEPDTYVHDIDLIKGEGMPLSFFQHFDAVVLDPPWEYRNTWEFLDRALYSLAEHPNARILLSYCPLHMAWLEGKEQAFWARLARWGMVCDEMVPACHLYSLKGTGFLDVLSQLIPVVSSPFLDVLREVPFGFSNLYLLRKAQNIHVPWWKKMWFKRWYTE